MVVDGVTRCHTDEGEEEEDDGEAVEKFGREVETEHSVDCPETKEGEEFDVFLEGQLQEDQPKGVRSEVLADLVIEEEVENSVEKKNHNKNGGH